MPVKRLLMAKKRKKSSIGTLLVFVVFMVFVVTIFNSGEPDATDATPKNVQSSASRENDNPLALQSVWYKQGKEGEGAIYVCFNRAISRTESNGLTAVYGVSYIVHTKDNQQEKSGEGYYRIKDVIPVLSLNENGKEINRCYHLLSQSPYRKNHGSYFSKENLARVERLRKDNIASVEVELYKKRVTG
jgi:hypothetical protein